ncbi:MAG TPA: TetR family transcriptional regulator C-terminal domain-containing protein [Streptosporangiaceae bacterium]
MTDGAPGSLRRPTAGELTPKGRATRDRIVAAAADLMFEQGVAGTSLQDVQQAARVSGSQLYHYFGDKASLVRAVIAWQGETVLGQQWPWLSRLDSLPGIRAWRDYVVSTMRRRECRGGCHIGSLASELSDLDPAARSGLAAAFGRWISAIRDGLQAMQERGELRAEADVPRLACALMAAVEGGLLLAKAQRDVAPLEAALDTVIDHIASLAA